jgi:hypothetical protein
MFVETPLTSVLLFNCRQLKDALEEVEEHRQSVAQWKRKTQKLQGEMHDQKLLLEEQVLLKALFTRFDVW